MPSAMRSSLVVIFYTADIWEGLCLSAGRGGENGGKRSKIIYKLKASKSNKHEELEPIRIKEKSMILFLVWSFSSKALWQQLPHEV